MNQPESEFYSFCNARTWAATLSEDEIISLIKNTPFVLEQIELKKKLIFH